MAGGAAATLTMQAGQARAAAATARAERLLADRTAAEERRDRGGTVGLQDPADSAAATQVAGVPVRLRIPAIGVDTVLERLRRDSRGVLQAPHYADQAGWFADGVVPGSVGAAVIVGHVDTILGPAVFEDLRRLRPGNRLIVDMSGGTHLVYRVDGSRVVQKALFPSDAVYGPTPDPQLRVITCSEPFDPVAKTYTDNLVLFATEVSS